MRVQEGRREVSPAERAMLFTQTTRQHLQVLPPVTAAPGAEVSFILPKTRLLSKIRLLVEGTLTATHASLTTFTPLMFAPYQILRQIRVEMNNGFTPVRISGRSAYFTMLFDRSAKENVPVYGAPASRRRAILGTAASVGGVANPLRFNVDLPVTLNDRDPSGLILLQNEETVMTCTLTVGVAADLVGAPAGFTFTLSSLTITPIIETFSIPAVENALPDLSILKLVQEQSESIPGAGVREVRLPTGTTYRKLAFFVADGAGAGVGDASLTGDIELIFNQADTPYRIRPRQLSAINALHYDLPLPDGLWVFDFSAHMGLPGYSGARDFIDTERLTEFWLRLNPSVAGSITTIYEVLSQLTA